jgi:hypothetical protein
MKIIFILLSLTLFTFLTIGFSIMVLNKMKGSKLYYFVKRHIITDEDLEN